MTTIAYRDGVIAADSLLTYTTEAGGSRKYPCKKLFRKTIGRGRRQRDVIIGTAGDAAAAQLFVDWFGSNQPIPEMLKEAGDFTCLIVDRNELFEADFYCRPVKITQPFYAIGSGCKEALAAMHCGRTAREAVEIAARIDLYTGGDIVTMRL